jgi:hypothetical protein
MGLFEVDSKNEKNESILILSKNFKNWVFKILKINNTNEY